MVADIDSATDHVHVLFYIWLPDHNGSKVVEALKRAAARGVTCRAMADDFGSRTIIRSEHWQAMRVAAGLPIGNPLLRPFEGRIDLRNHRKIVVVDDRITYWESKIADRLSNPPPRPLTDIEERAPQCDLPSCK